MNDFYIYLMWMTAGLLLGAIMACSFVIRAVFKATFAGHIYPIVQDGDINYALGFTPEGIEKLSKDGGYILLNVDRKVKTQK